MRESPRTRRLRTDHASLERLRADSTILDFEAEGNPPERYLLRFRGRGAFRPEAGAPVRLLEMHEVSIRLGANYPRMMPELQWRSPIFHPNVSGSGVVCLGGYGTHWVPSVNLDELCEMLWDMLRYANYDVNSPYNREAAAWARQQTQFAFPLDRRSLRDRVAAGQRPADAAPPKPQPAVKQPGAQQPPASPDDVLFIIDSNSADEIVDAEVVDSGSDILFLE